MRSFVFIHGVTDGNRDPNWDLPWARAVYRAVGAAHTYPINWDRIATHDPTHTHLQDLGSDLLEIINAGVYSLIDKILAVAPPPITIMAHSLGSLLALRYLHSHPRGKIVSLITFGSPLARLDYYGLSRVTIGGLSFPPTVKTWDNLWSPFDKICSSAFWGYFFTGALPNAGNHRVWCSHSSERYLRTTTMRKVIQCAA